MKILFLFFISVTCAHAATFTASSTSQSDVQAAINKANPGDTVVIPAGVSNWTSSITLSKAITLQGTGGYNSENPKVPATTVTQINSTKSFANGLSDTEPPTSLDSQIFKIAPATDVPIRITGIYFNMQNIPLYTHTGGYQGPDKSGIQVFGFSRNDYGDSDANAPVLTQIRIDHCYFNSGKMQVHVFGHVEGVIDHNTFINGDVGVGVWGYDSDAWVSPPNVPGTVHSMFVEDNTFLVDNNVTWTNSNWAIDHQSYNQEGARSVIRHNNFDLSAFTKDSGYFLDVHGNQNYYSSAHWNLRGNPLVEIYSNTFKGSTYQLAELRGGSVIFHDNVITGSGSFSIEMWEEEGWQSGFFSPLRTAAQWPAEDQINASFFWNNTLNGSTLNPISGNPRVGSSNESGLIKLGRDYWLSAPNSTTKTSYPNPPAPSSAYQNIYAPITSYTPFTYPHPLIGAASTPSVPIIANNTTIPVAVGATMVNVITAGVYKLIGSVIAPDGGSDSFWIDFDKNPANDDTRCWDLVDTTVAANQTAIWRGTGTAISPKTWTLTTGTHTLYVGARETGAQISKVQFVLNDQATPAPLAPTGVHIKASTR